METLPPALFSQALDPLGTLMKAVVLDSFGEPADVLRILDVPEPKPGAGQVRVRMLASPVNPSDLLLTRGRYVFRPQLPARPGFEGVGIVEEAGPGLYGRFLVGRRVAVLNGEGGNWAESALIPATQAIPVGKDLPDEQVASYFVNPATALAMVRHVLKVEKGEWLLQSAATSALGKMIIRLGRRDGFKTLNVVRRPEAIEELKALGADEVICSTEGPIPEQVRRIVGANGVRCAIDPVGGETGTGLYDSLAADGMLVVYGSLTPEPIRIDPRSMISAKRTVRGFWLGHWMRERSKLAALTMFRQIAELIRLEILATDLGPSFPIEAIGEAVQAAEQPGKPGKVLLSIGRT
ncbi:zinc-dependent alcohol dehydrogenase family protein [soil metagenome]